MKQHADVLIVGGGLMGCSIALELQKKGKSVIILEKDVPGRHASGNNSGGVRAQGRDYREVPFALASRQLWNHHLESVKSDCGFYVSPRLRLAENEAEMLKLEERAAKLNKMGFKHEELLDRDEVRKLSPNLAGHIVGGLICRTDGLANPMKTSKAYARAAQARGIQLVTHTRVTAAQSHGSGFSLQTSTGKTFSGEILINAAGAWAAKFAAMLGDEVAVFAEAPTMMVTDRLPGLLRGTSLGLTGRLLGLMAAQNETIIVGGGYRSPLDLDKEEIYLDPFEMTRAARLMSEIVPALAEAQMIRCWAAFEGSVKDKVPIIGESSRIPGFFHCCGFSAHGFQMVPIIGRLMAQLICSGETELSLHDFRPDRFEEAALPSSG